VSAGTAEGERAILIALHFFEQVKNAIGLDRFKGVGLVVPFFIDFRIEAEYFQSYIHWRLY